MTAPLFHAAAGSLASATAGAQLVLDGPEGRHAAAVRRIGVGEQVWLADGSGRVAECTVTDGGKSELALRVDVVREEPMPAPQLVLVQALAKDGRDQQAVESATELGVDRVLPWQADRSIVQWRAERAAKAHAKWVATAQAAAKQARRARVPEIGELVRRPELVRAVTDAALAVVLHEEADASLTSLDLPTDGEALVVVGPEGGISPEELQALTAAGARCVRLGPTVLRSSTAGPAALAVLASRTRW